MNKKFWTEHYKKHKITEPSSFAQWVLSSIKGTLVDLGCGDGRDLYFFRKKGITAFGVDASNEDVFIIRQSVLEYIKNNPCPENVYTRFFWHAIEREEQLAILKWTKGNLYIEARTTKDKPKNIIGKHKRHLVNVERLKKDLISNGFEILNCVEGLGMSIYKGEDPYLVRIVAKKVV